MAAAGAQLDAQADLGKKDVTSEYLNVACGHVSAFMCSFFTSDQCYVRGGGGRFAGAAPKLQIKPTTSCPTAGSSVVLMAKVLMAVEVVEISSPCSRP